MQIRINSFAKAATFAMLILNTLIISAQDNSSNNLPHFLFPDFREGVVFMKADKPFTTFLNYNLLEERMVTEFNGTYRYSKDPALIDSIRVSNRIFIPVEGKFYEMVSRGRFTFLVQHHATLIERGHDVGYGVRSQSTGPSQYKRFELNSYWGNVAYLDIPVNSEVRIAPVFWVTSGTGLEKFSNSKQLIKRLPGYKPVIQEYLEKEKVNFRSVEDVARMADFLNGFTGER